MDKGFRYPRPAKTERIEITDRAPKGSVWLSPAGLRIVVAGHRLEPPRVLVRADGGRKVAALPAHEFFDGTWKRSFVDGRAEEKR